MLLYSRMGEAKPLPIQAGATLAKPPSRAQVFFYLPDQCAVRVRATYGGGAHLG